LENVIANYSKDLNYTSYDMIGYCPNGNFVNIAPANTPVNYSLTGSAFLWADASTNSSKGTLNFQSTPPLDPTLVAQAHVHMLTCDVLGGLHWKFDTSISTTVASNEFWFNPKLTPNQPAGGVSATYSDSPFSSTVALDKRPRSIVLHLNGTKIQCCNLEFVSKFAFASSGAWTQLDGRVSVTGDVSVYVSDTSNTTAGDLNFQINPGTSDAAYFEAHVQNQNCSSGSGSHWKYNTSITSALQSNEIWWTFNGTGDGTNTVSEFSIQMNNDNFRPDQVGFKSVVIHAPKAQGAPKLACADLTITPLGLSLTSAPTASPTSAPTNAPTESPSMAPTGAPTKAPTKKAALSSSVSLATFGAMFAMLFAKRLIS
jgi:hypothetical protein